MDFGFLYAMEYAVMLEADYPYEAKEGECRYVASKGKAKLTDSHDVDESDPDQLRAAVDIGPVSVAIEADQFFFQGYTTGVITQGCGTKLDHIVLAVGYGSTIDSSGDEVNYFIIKNSKRHKDVKV